MANYPLGQFSTDIVAMALCHICAAAGAARGLSTPGPVSVRPQKEFGSLFCEVHMDRIFSQKLH